jgi:hypothetical protein
MDGLQMEPAQPAIVALSKTRRYSHRSSSRGLRLSGSSVSDHLDVGDDALPAQKSSISCVSAIPPIIEPAMAR